MNRSSSNDSKRSDTEDSNNFDSNSSDCGKRKFVFPPAPRLCKSANNTSCSVSCQSDSSVSDGKIVKSKRRNRRRNPKILPSIGVFWDIENCQVPRNKSASSIVQKVRELFFDGYREAEFIVVCDVKKEHAHVIQDLHDAQVNLIHVSSTSKNAADEKLRQSLRRFADTHPAPSAVILISGDINFAGDLSDLRYRKKIHVILVHNTNVADALILCANETYSYSCVTENLPVLKLKTTNQHDILITKLPINYDKNKLKQRLKYLSDNCGGKVLNIDSEQGIAVLRFSSLDFASRAQRRLKGEDVFGYKIRASNPTNSRDSPCRSYSGRKIKGTDFHQVQPFAVPPPGFPVQDAGLYHQGNQNTSRDSWKSLRDQDLQAKSMISLQENVFRPVRGIPNLMNISQDQLWGHNSFSERRALTPQEELGSSSFSYQSRARKTNVSGEFNDENKSFRHIGNFHAQGQNNSPIELVISSLDPSIEVKDLRRVLTNLLKEYVRILGLNITTQADGTPIAILKVDTQQEAQYAISQLHHYKLGYKRITISYAQNNMLDPSQLREMVIALLQEVPGHRMPLFKLIELLESRFHINVSVSEVNKLKDVCRITDELGGRIITLTPEIRNSPPASLNRTSTLYCSVHCPNGLENRGWGEAESSQLPNINMSLRLFTTVLNSLLSSHMGTLPLLSLPVCYQIEFGDTLPIDENGVPLEHLVTCVTNIDLKYGGPSRNIKYIKREDNLKLPETEKDEAFLKSMSPSIVSNVQLLCRELVDLLKTTEKCQLLLSRFIPAYHHHFGRQCRVADYGYTKLVDLLESQIISNVVQILGDGTKRVITLTHSTQIRRFTSDLLRVLKSQVSKQVTLDEFPSAFERTLTKPFNAVEYGLCSFEDLLDEIPENTVVVSKNCDVVTISIPKREQTAEEIVRTKQFAEEVVKLLCHSAQSSMLFNKFVPAYHHHFGHQCKVSDYGFTKLIELFEAIPDTVKIEELSDGERKVTLTLPRALKVLGNQITEIIKHSKLASLAVEALSGVYLREFGYPLKPEAYDCGDVKELVSKLSDFIQIAQSSAGPLLVLVASETQSTVTMRIWAILLQTPHSLNVSFFINEYRMRFQSNICVSKLEQMKEVVTIFENKDQHISLTPFYILAAQLYQVVYRSGGHVPYTNLENMYRRNYDKNICYSDFNVNSMDDLISQMNFVLLIRGTRKRTNIVLNQKLAEFGIPLTSTNSTENGQFYKKEDPAVHWPPPPAHDLVLSNTNRGITPPKPDTPPEPGSAPWYSWNTPTKFSTHMDLSIPLPAVHISQLKGYMDSLVSPTKHLLSADSNPVGSVVAIISPPHPTELPMPDKLLLKDDSNDSGVVNNSNVTSETEMDVSAEKTGKI